LKVGRQRKKRENLRWEYVNKRREEVKTGSKMVGWGWGRRWDGVWGVGEGWGWVGEWGVRGGVM
jgi:hypothetical protein